MLVSDEEQEGKGNEIVSVKANIIVPGESLDKAAADVLKSALNLPATEASGLLGDAIGVIGDRLKVFRFENRVSCLIAAGDRLAKKGLTLEQAKQISEGEAYDLLEGMGGADNPDTRRMWAGLMASAMDPESGVSADKGFVRILEAMSQREARIIEFLADVKLFEESGRAEAQEFSAKVNEAGGDMQSEILQHWIEESNERKTVARGLLTKKASSLGELGSGDLLNLRRLGLVETIGHSTSPRIDFYGRGRDSRELEHLVEEIGKRIEGIETTLSVNDDSQEGAIQVTSRGDLQISCKLSRFGEQFIEACGLLDES